jgi:hypothetical protein
MRLEESYGFTIPAGNRSAAYGRNDVLLPEISPRLLGRIGISIKVILPRRAYGEQRLPECAKTVAFATLVAFEVDLL